MWANFLAVGLVEKVDDLRITNPSSNEKLLSATAKYLASQHYDLKSLMRLILQSETYQRSSVTSPENAPDQRFYSHYYPRRMMAEVLLDSISEVTAVPTEFSTDLRNANRGLGAKYPVGYRAMQLPDSHVESYFLRSFGRPVREATCECERTAEPSMAQALHIANGDTVNEKLKAKGNQIEKALAAKIPPAQIVEDAYLSGLSRFPTESEKSKIMGILNGCGDADLRMAIEDVYWAILSSREFLFNH